MLPSVHDQDPSDDLDPPIHARSEVRELKKSLVILFGAEANVEAESGNNASHDFKAAVQDEIDEKCL